MDRYFTGVMYIVHFTTTFSYTHFIILTQHLHSSYLPMHSDRLAEKLYAASLHGRDQAVLELLQRGAPPNNSDYYTREHYGSTPLHRACTWNHLHSAELLIKFGASVTATANIGWTPLHDACYYNRMDTAKLLLEHHCTTGEPGCWSSCVCHLVKVCGSGR